MVAVGLEVVEFAIVLAVVFVVVEEMELEFNTTDGLVTV